MRHSTIWAISLILAVCTCCQHPVATSVESSSSQTDWQTRLEEMLPLLGHRNWIVITDMAYPLQSGQGLVTLYADQPYLEVLEKTLGLVNQAPHIFAHVYRDRELDYITDSMVPGIEDLKVKSRQTCGAEAKSLPHEDLIRKLDEAGKLFTVVIIKTPLTIPYTTTFLELDCAYWNASLQQALDSNLSGKK